MESTLALKEDTYAPNVDNTGKYIDYLPRVTNGIRCPCNIRKDKVYLTAQTFHGHTKTKQHMKWLESLNNNRANYFLEAMELRDTVQTQQKIIAALEKEVKLKSNTVDYLTMQLYKPKSTDEATISYDLLDMVID